MIRPGRNKPEGTQTPFVVIKNTYHIRRKIKTFHGLKVVEPVLFITTGTLISYLIIPPSVLKTSVAKGLYWGFGQ